MEMSEFENPDNDYRGVDVSIDESEVERTTTVMGDKSQA